MSLQIWSPHIPEGSFKVVRVIAGVNWFSKGGSR
jgi:hypothetical protein